MYLQLFSFLFGLIIGSFLNVCIYRIPNGISVVSPPSHCPKCQRRLGLFDLVPLLSYLLLKGRCRYCGEQISLRYPLVELFSGMGFLVLFLQFDLTLKYLSAVLLFSGLVVCSLIDYDQKIIPNQVNLVLLLVGTIILGLQSITLLLNGLIGLAVGFGLLFLIAVVSKGGMGGGDVKLAGVLGLYVGWPNILLVLFLSFLIGSVFGLIWALLNQKSLKTFLPFGPFLSVAAMLVLLWGQEIINWYWSLFKIM